jgi:hypothetical protein
MNPNLIERRQFGIAVSPVVHDGVARRAKAMGLSPTAFAKLLFEAGYAARIGQERGAPATDAELDEQVRLVFSCAGQGDAAAISKATGVSEVRVKRILDAWKQAGRGR